MTVDLEFLGRQGERVNKEAGFGVGVGDLLGISTSQQISILPADLRRPLRQLKARLK